MSDDLPRRGDEDLWEGTDCPVFLIQRRRFQPTELSAIDWDVDSECLRDKDGNELTEEDAVAREYGVWEWDTQRVAFTRDEAQEWADARPYRGPWRVYSVPALGELRTLLRAQTDYKEPLVHTIAGEPGKYTFWCPGCECGHWFQTGTGEGPRWNFNLDRHTAPTVTPSIIVRGGKQGSDHVCHLYMTNGKLRFLNDCTHALKGQTVDMQPFP